jgi:O-antigen ligase
MGERLRLLQYWGGNQAHNGYLEIYVNLGYTGLILLGLVIVAGFRNIIASSRINPEMGPLKAAFFIICLTYNFSEATFKMMAPVWLMFLWATHATPASRLKPVPLKSSFKPPVSHTFVPRTRVKAG